jgi:hypothetical protein
VADIQTIRQVYAQIAEYKLAGTVKYSFPQKYLLIIALNAGTKEREQKICYEFNIVLQF